MNINDRVEFTFDAMPGRVAYGKIIFKAPVGQPIKRNSPVKFFDVEASIDSAQVLPKPGVSATCNIIIQRVKDTIVVPQLAIFEEDSLKMVYIKLDHGYERRQIIIGPSSPKNAVVVSGLSGKESLSIIKPSSAHIKKTTFLPKPVMKGKTPTKIVKK